MFPISRPPHPDSVLWTSAFADPRLVSAGHSGQRLLLDAPIRRDGVRTINDLPDGYSARPYASYEDIRGGDISYYADTSVNVPYITPTLFDPTCRLTKREYVDPMFSCKPEYDSPTDTCSDALSFLADTRFHRQDLMKKQLYRRNWTHPMYFAAAAEATRRI